MALADLPSLTFHIIVVEVEDHWNNDVTDHLVFGPDMNAARVQEQFNYFNGMASSPGGQYTLLDSAKFSYEVAVTLVP